MKRVLRDNGLTLALMAAFLLTLLGMMLAGQRVANEELAAHGMPPIGVAEYFLSPRFVSALFENWESEFLQMAAYVVLTAYLFQRGSAESRDPDEPDRENDELPADLWRGRRVRRWLYGHSLGLALVALFLVSFYLHWMGSLAEANEDALLHGRPTHGALAHLADAQMWFESFQNWQSEFLSTAVLAVLSIVLRYQGSPESKPVNAENGDTGAG